MNWWSVWVEHRGDEPTAITDDSIGHLVNVLVPCSGIATGGGGHPCWGARISIETATAAEATQVVAGRGLAAGLPAWPVVRAEATREDVVDTDLVASE